MKRIWRLLLYVRPYALYSLASVMLMAIVGAMAAFRILLVKPIFDNVLRPDAVSHDVLVFRLPYVGRVLNLHFLVPSHLHNAWNVVAYALVVSALLKSVCDYAGTYLVNYAGFGMITDLRNDLYNAVLRRSVAFFQKHTTGTLLSTLINDIERVQFAMSSGLGDFLQERNGRDDHGDDDRARTYAEAENIGRHQGVSWRGALVQSQHNRYFAGGTRAHYSIRIQQSGQPAGRFSSRR